MKINKANVFGDLNDGGDAVAWVDLEWGGIIKQSKRFKKDHVNQIFYFKLSVPEVIRRN